VLRAEDLSHAALTELLEKRVLSKLLRFADLLAKAVDHARCDRHEGDAHDGPHGVADRGDDEERSVILETRSGLELERVRDGEHGQPEDRGHDEGSPRRAGEEDRARRGDDQSDERGDQVRALVEREPCAEQHEAELHEDRRCESTVSRTRMDRRGPRPIRHVTRLAAVPGRMNP
jgi:hypothetical protein